MIEKPSFDPMQAADEMLLRLEPYAYRIWHLLVGSQCSGVWYARILVCLTTLPV